jgi:hypothetical protein
MLFGFSPTDGAGGVTAVCLGGGIGFFETAVFADFLTDFFADFFDAGLLPAFFATFLALFIVRLPALARFFAAAPFVAREGLRSFFAFRFLTAVFLAFATPNSSLLRQYDRE